MFRGINSLTLDEKGRLAIPVRYREEINSKAQGQLILTIDTEQPCLLLYPLPIWEEIESKIVELPAFHPATRRIQRLLVGHATEIAMDRNGRVLLPQLLREYATLGKQALLLGQGHKFELWDETAWKEKRNDWLKNGLTSDHELPEGLQSITL